MTSGADGAALLPERLGSHLFSSGSHRRAWARSQGLALGGRAGGQMALGERWSTPGCWPASVNSTSTACCFASCCRWLWAARLIAAASDYSGAAGAANRPLGPWIAPRLPRLRLDLAIPAARLPADRLLAVPATGRCPSGQTAARSAAGEIFGSSETGGIGWRQRHQVQTPGRRCPESRCGSVRSVPAAALPLPADG